jgi:hypothetical protein
MRSSIVRSQVRRAMRSIRSIFSGAMTSPPSLHCATKRNSPSSSLHLASSSARKRMSVATVGDTPPVFDLRVALQYLEAHAHVVQSIVDGLQLGGFVDDVLGCGDLAAVVQPRGDMQRLPLLVAHREVAERPFARIARRPGEHRGDLRHPLAVTAGVRRLGIDCSGDQPDQRVEELFLLPQENLVFYCDSRGARQRFDEGQEVPRQNAGRGAVQKADDAEYLPAADW